MDTCMDVSTGGGGGGIVGGFWGCNICPKRAKILKFPLSAVHPIL